MMTSSMCFQLINMLSNVFSYLLVDITNIIQCMRKIIIYRLCILIKLIKKTTQFQMKYKQK